MQGNIRLFNDTDREVHAALKIGPLLLAKKNNLAPRASHVFSGLAFVWVTLEINDKVPFHFTSWMPREEPGMVSLSIHAIFPEMEPEEKRIFLQFGPDRKLELSETSYSKPPPQKKKTGTISFRNQSELVAHVGLRNEEQELLHHQNDIPPGATYHFREIEGWWSVEANMSFPYNQLGQTSRLGASLIIRKSDIFASPTGTFVVLQPNSEWPQTLEINEFLDPFLTTNFQPLRDPQEPVFPLRQNLTSSLKGVNVDFSPNRPSFRPDRDRLVRSATTKIYNQRPFDQASQPNDSTNDYGQNPQSPPKFFRSRTQRNSTARNTPSQFNEYEYGQNIRQDAPQPFQSSRFHHNSITNSAFQYPIPQTNTMLQSGTGFDQTDANFRQNSPNLSEPTELNPPSNSSPPNDYTNEFSPTISNLTPTKQDTDALQDLPPEDLGPESPQDIGFSPEELIVAKPIQRKARNDTSTSSSASDETQSTEHDSTSTSTEDTSAENASAEDASTENASTENASTENASTENASAEDASAEDASAENPSEQI